MTDRLDGALVATGRSVDERRAALPLGHAEPDDIANALAFLLDARSGFVTRQTVYFCGGMTIGAA